jgi:hypothetical protein
MTKVEALLSKLKEHAGRVTVRNDGNLIIKGENIPNDLINEILLHKTAVISAIYCHYCSKAAALAPWVDDEGSTELLNRYNEMLQNISKIEPYVPESVLRELFPDLYKNSN